MKLVLRDYQQDGVTGIRMAFARGSRRVIYALPTGGGKTPVFCHIAESAMNRGKRVLIVVHRRELLRQASGKLVEMGVPHGVIAPGRCMSYLPVQVGSVQTINRRKLKDPDLIIIDEAHHAVNGNQWGGMIEEYSGAYVLGVSATPARLDGRGLGSKVGGYFDEIVRGPEVTDLMNRGFLAPYEAYGPPGGQVNMEGVHTRAGDWDKKESEERVDRRTITGCAISEYRKRGKGMPALAFCVSVKHAEHVAEDFRAAGYRTAVLHGKTPTVERDGILERLAGGLLDVVSSCDVLSEGVDVPGASVAILLRPTQSLTVHLQQIGRILRPLPGKTAIILDHVGNCIGGLGLPDTPRDWELNAVKKKRRTDGEKVIPVRQCAMCYLIHDTAPRCPRCGYAYPVQKRNALEQVDGELAKIEAGMIRSKLRQEQGRCQSLQELMAFAAKTGKSKGWAFHVWKSRKKQMPRARMDTGRLAQGVLL